jgi:hypothetical protein
VETCIGTFGNECERTDYSSAKKKKFKIVLGETHGPLAYVLQKLVDNSLG